MHDRTLRSREALTPTGTSTSRRRRRHRPNPGDGVVPCIDSRLSGSTAVVARPRPLVRVGVEGTGSYGAGLARHLMGEGVVVIEVDRPDRQRRRRRGKSDTVDAEAAARAALNGDTTATPKSGDGQAESVRVLRMVRRSAVEARTQAANQISDLIVTAPDHSDPDCETSPPKLVSPTASASAPEMSMVPPRPPRLATHSRPTPCGAHQRGGDARRSDRGTLRQPEPGSSHCSRRRPRGCGDASRHRR